MLRFILVFISLVVSGCASESGPSSINETSASTALLKDRVEFIEQYVTFDRMYDELEYSVFYQNNGGGGIPGPSDWDIRIVAKVPPEQIQAWVPANSVAGAAPATKWFESTADKIDVSSISEWHTDGQRSVGLDRQNSIVVYRNSTLGH